MFVSTAIGIFPNIERVAADVYSLFVRVQDAYCASLSIFDTRGIVSDVPELNT